MKILMREQQVNEQSKVQKIVEKEEVQSNFEDLSKESWDNFEAEENEKSDEIRNRLFKKIIESTQRASK
jgi:hypothetical protein